MSGGPVCLLTPISSRPSSPVAAKQHPGAFAGQHGDSGAHPAAVADSSSAGAQQRWRSPPCCAGCGAAKATAGSCSGCGSWFCKACMGPAARGITGDSSRGPSGLGGPCSNCSNLCNACKPISCSFCEDEGEFSPNRLCEACAGTCDACQRTACDSCAAAFSSCSSCGYAICEECRLQLQLGGAHEAAAGSGDGLGTAVGGCWCAPPIRTASNVRHVSSQRYQMAQLHPSFLASSMEAAGLRDADDDEDYTCYDEYDELTATAAAAAAEVASGGASSNSSSLLADEILQQHYKQWQQQGGNSLASSAEGGATVAASSSNSSSIHAVLESLTCMLDPTSSLVASSFSPPASGAGSGCSAGSGVGLSALVAGERPSARCFPGHTNTAGSSSFYNNHHMVGGVVGGSTTTAAAAATAVAGRHAAGGGWGLHTIPA